MQEINGFKVRVTHLRVVQPYRETTVIGGEERGSFMVEKLVIPTTAHTVGQIRRARAAGLPWKVYPLGGFTVATLHNRETDELVATGIAECSEKDAYNKKVGRAIAIGRAFKTLDDEPTTLAEERRYKRLAAVH